MAQTAQERRQAQKRNAKSVKSGSMGPKSKIGAKARQVASSAKSTASNVATSAKQHLSTDQFKNNSGSSTLVGGPAKGKHAGSYNHAKDVAAVSHTGDTSFGRHSKGM